jgi:hypothetical protein
MQLYNTKVVPATEDGLWSLPEELPSLSGMRLLIISSPIAQDSQEEQTLQKMMAACKLNTGEYCIISLEPQAKLSLATLAGAGIPQRILLLGVSPAQLAINALFRLNSPNAYMGYTIIPSLSLSEIERAPELKKELWGQGLKPAFGL